MEKEIRVYGIKPDHSYARIKLGSRPLLEICDEEWINEAEAQGLVWSLSGFQYAFNNDQLNQQDLFIRII